MDMYSTICEDKIQILEFSSQEEMNHTMFRISAFYESHNEQLINKKFTIKQYFKNDIKKVEDIKNWKKRILGYNIPPPVIKQFFSIYSDNELTRREKELKKIYAEDCYLIGIFDVQKHKITLEHEYIHALFYLHPEYQKRIMSHFFSKKFKNITNYILEYIKSSDQFLFGKNSYLDELNAYSCTQPIIDRIMDMNTLKLYDKFCQQCFMLQFPLKSSEEFTREYLDIRTAQT